MALPLEHLMRGTTASIKSIAIRLALLASLTVGDAGSQQVERLPPMQAVADHDLRTVLAIPGQFSHEASRFVYRAAQLTDDTRRMFLRLLADPQTGAVVRSNIIYVLGMEMHPSTVEPLLEIARRPGPLQSAAWTALQAFPDHDVCEFWRESLRDPRASGGVFSEIAMVGVSLLVSPRTLHRRRGRAARWQSPLVRISHA